MMNLFLKARATIDDGNIVFTKLDEITTDFKIISIHVSFFYKYCIVLSSALFSFVSNAVIGFNLIWLIILFLCIDSG